MRSLSFLCVALGAVAVTGSAVWWWITYGQVIQYDYISAGEAGLCLVGDSEICRLARSLCRGAHPSEAIAYRAAAFWIGVASVSASLMMPGRRGS